MGSGFWKICQILTVLGACTTPTMLSSRGLGRQTQPLAGEADFPLNGNGACKCGPCWARLWAPRRLRLGPGPTWQNPMLSCDTALSKFCLLMAETFCLPPSFVHLRLAVRMFAMYLCVYHAAVLRVIHHLFLNVRLFIYSQSWIIDCSASELSWTSELYSVATWSGSPAL